MNKTIYKSVNIIIMLLCLLLGVINYTCSAQNANLKEMTDYNNVTFYTGTLFKAVLQQKVSTEFNNIGDKVELINPTDVRLGEFVCIPQNTKFIGKIVKLEKPKIGSNGSFQIIFDTLKLPDGQTISIMASVWTKKGDGIVGGEATPRINFRPMTYNIEGVGSYIHKLPAGPRDMGKNSELLPGYEVLIVLDQKLNFNISKD
jgi:hypothetical protein